MNIFAHDGNNVFDGIWSTITAARSFDAALLSIPKEATHWVRYTAGTTAELVVGELVHGNTTAAATANVVKVVTEQGTVGATTAAGILFLRNRSTTAFTAETVHAAGSGGTVVIAQDPILLNPGSPHPKALLIEIESFALTVTTSGLLPTAAAGTNHGISLDPGQSMIIRGVNNIRNFQAINTVNASGSIMKYQLFY